MTQTSQRFAGIDRLYGRGAAERLSTAQAWHSPSDLSIPQRWALGLLVLTPLLVAVALGLVRALNKRATVQAQARQAAEALQQTPVYTLGTNDLVTVRSLPLTQTEAVSGSLKALQTAAIKAKVF